MLLILLMSENVNVCCSPDWLSQTSATLSGSAAAMSSTMSYPKLKLSGHLSLYVFRRPFSS